MQEESARARLAQAAVIDHAMCEDCDENYLFELKRDKDVFAVGLTTVLACLAFAEQQGAVPKLPVEWWCTIGTHYDGRH